MSECLKWMTSTLSYKNCFMLRLNYLLILCGGSYISVSFWPWYCLSQKPLSSPHSSALLCGESCEPFEALFWMFPPNDLSFPIHPSWQKSVSQSFNDFRWWSLDAWYACVHAIRDGQTIDDKLNVKWFKLNQGIKLYVGKLRFHKVLCQSPPFFSFLIFSFYRGN